jgi:hypothetical protein
MRSVRQLLVYLMFLTLAAAPLAAQGMPTTQPGRLAIFVENIKVGMDEEHEKNETGWPAVLSRTGSTSYYLALTARTGPNQAWYITPYDSYAAEAKQMKWVEGVAGLGNELGRLWRADAQYLESTESFDAIARPDLSYGEFPDLALARHFEITTLRIRLGHEQSFEAAAKVYMANFKRANPNGSYRMYQVLHGMPGSNYLIFSSVNDFADFDRILAADNAMFASVSPKDMAILQKTTAEDFQNVFSNQFSVSAAMSYVAPETKAKDPAFWNKR